MSVSAISSNSPFSLFRETRQARQANPQYTASTWQPAVTTQKPEKRHLLRKVFAALVAYKLFKVSAKHLPFSSLLQQAKQRLNLFA